MEKVNGNIEKRLPEAEEIWTGNVTMEEPRKETNNRSVNPGQVLPLMQVSLRNSKLASSQIMLVRVSFRLRYPYDVLFARVISNRCDGCH